MRADFCFLSFSFLNIMRYRSKTRSSWRTIFMFLSAAGSEWCVLVIGTTPQICETAKYDPRKKKGWVYFIPFCNFVISVGWLRQYDGLDDREIVVRFLKRPKPTLEPTQAPRLNLVIKWPGLKLITDFHLVSRLRMRGTILPLPIVPYCVVFKYRNNSAFTSL